MTPQTDSNSEREALVASLDQGTSIGRVDGSLKVSSCHSRLFSSKSPPKRSQRQSPR